MRLLRLLLCEYLRFYKIYITSSTLGNDCRHRQRTIKNGEVWLGNVSHIVHKRSMYFEHIYIVFLRMYV